MNVIFLIQEEDVVIIMVNQNTFRQNEYKFRLWSLHPPIPNAFWASPTYFLGATSFELRSGVFNLGFDMWTYSKDLAPGISLADIWRSGHLPRTSESSGPWHLSQVLGISDSEHLSRMFGGSMPRRLSWELGALESHLSQISGGFRPRSPLHAPGAVPRHLPLDASLAPKDIFR